MNFSFKNFKVLLFISILTFGGNIMAHTMKVVSVEVRQFQIPVLIGKETNPVLQIKIETFGAKTPLTLRELEIGISGTDIAKDIREVGIFYTEEKPFLLEGIRFEIPEKPDSKIIFTSHQKLNEGTNIFWVSFKLNNNANILNEVNSKCLAVKINNRKIIPEIISEVKSLKMGIALRKHNDDGVHTYRIPGLATTNNGTLIAVYDVRRNNSADYKKILMLE